MISLNCRDEGQPSASGSQSEVAVKEDEDDDDPNNVRKPSTNPFQRTMMGGIGRGSVPSATVGIGRGRAVLSWGQRSGTRDPGQSNGDSAIKRERPDDYPSAKRFSPEYHESHR